MPETPATSAHDAHSAAALTVEDIAHAILPPRSRKVPTAAALRDNIRAAVFPLALRCEELSAKLAKLERLLREQKHVIRQEIEGILVDWIDGRR